MIIQSQGYEINSFEVPAFTLNKGEMVRFWIQVVPISQNAPDGYQLPMKILEKIETTQLGREKIRVSPLRMTRSIFDFIKPVTLGKFLENRFKLSIESINEKLSFFDLNPDWKVKNLGFAHQKIFAIICSFQKYNIISFDYYGLAPDSEELLTAYVKSELEKGKSAISFDNLNYRPSNPDAERIINIDVRQKR